MSLDQYHHGARVLELTAGARAIRTIATAVIGLIATGADADATVFPLNKPALITNLPAALGKAGTDGTLAKSLQAIADQVTAVVVVVRVPEGEGADAEAIAADQASKVIGGATPSGYTGMQALLAAQAQLGVKPRILGAPGLDSKPVATALATIAEKLRAMSYATCWDCETVAEATAYREDFGARELMLIYPDFLAWNTVANAYQAAPATAYALGLRAKIDAEQGWHKTLSNVAVNGVGGLSRDIFWDLQTSATDAGVLNEAGVTTLINSNGFKFWGSRTCSDDEAFTFESATRTAQVLADTIAEAHQWAIDKPLHPSLAKDILEGCNAKFRELRNLGYILDANAWFDEEVNTIDRLKQGKFAIDFDYTPLPPLEDLAFRQRITDRYFADFSGRIAA